MTINDKIKNKLLKNYPILKEADNKDYITWMHPKPIFKPNNNIMWLFKVEINNKCLIEWFNDEFLSKPTDQRGSETDTDMTSPKRKNWIRCFFSELENLQTSSYVFSFSNQWEDSYLSNGGHRINFTARFLNPQETIQNIDFDLEFTFINIEGNEKPKTVNLKGCRNLLDVKKRVGIRNWNYLMDNSYHSVDLYYFEFETGDEARKYHSEVFLYSNDNLPKIDKIHSIWSTVNNFVRPVSDWYGFDNDSILPIFKEIWSKKKVYNESKPYKLMLRAFLFWKKGFVPTDEDSLQEFVKNTPITENEKKNFKSDFIKALTLYKKQKELNSSRFSYNFTRMFEYFCQIMFILKRQRDWKENQYLMIGDEDAFVSGMDTAIKNLLTESTAAGEGKGTYHYDRSTSATEIGLLECVRKVLGKLILNNVIVERDPRRNIPKSEKELLPSECFILGVSVQQTDNEYHHIYKFYSQGGKSSIHNVVRCHKDVNQYIKDFETTSDAIKSMLNDKTWISKFSDEKLDYWKNGGMSDLIKKENDNTYLYQSDKMDLIELDTNDLNNSPHTYIDVKL